MRGTITNAGNMVLGEVSEGRAGTWALQVTSYTGLGSITPQVSVDGTNWVAASVVKPDTPSTLALTITANGVYYFDAPAGVKCRLLGAGTGSAVVQAVASLRA
jgi:hypothetical protein